MYFVISISINQDHNFLIASNMGFFLYLDAQSIIWLSSRRTTIIKNKDQGNFFFFIRKNNLMKKYKRTIMIKFSNLRLTTLLGYKTPRFSASLRNNTSGTAIVYVTFSNVRTEEKQNWLFSRVLWVSDFFSLHHSLPNMFASLQNQKQFVLIIYYTQQIAITYIFNT